MRILTRKSLPPWRWLKLFFLVDPRRLDGISSQMSGSISDSEKLKLAKEYSNIVGRICVGITTKTTRIDRMREMDIAITTLIKQTPGSFSNAAIKMLDMGASDGSSTMTALTRLKEECDVDASAIALDLYVELVEYKSGLFCEYRLNDGYPVLLRLGPIGIQLSPIAVARRPVEKLVGKCLSKLGFVGKSTNVQKSWSLLNPIVANSQKVSLQQGNLFEVDNDFVDQFEIVRASNVLNRSYFSDDLIKKGLYVAKQYVKNNGYLIVSRNRKSNEGEIENGTIWQRTDDSFHVATLVGDGSDVSELIDAYDEDSQTEVQNV